MRLLYSRYSCNRCPLSISSTTIALAFAVVLVVTTQQNRNGIFCCRTTLAFSSSQAASYAPRRAVSARRANIADNDENENDKCGFTFRDSWSLITLGDLHMEDDMSYHEQARRDCLEALEDFPLMGAPTAKATASNDDVSPSPSISMELNNDIVKAMCETPGGELTEEELRILLARKTNRYMQSHFVSVGDLGRKDIRHEQGDAGTTKSFVDAKTYFDGFGGIPYDLVTVRYKQYLLFILFLLVDLYYAFVGSKLNSNYLLIYTIIASVRFDNSMTL